MEDLTIGFAYYNQPCMANEWWPYLRSFPEACRKRFRFIFVDDASPDYPLAVPVDIANGWDVEIYRIEDDIPWNQPGARNLIMRHTKTVWNLLVDVDHVVPQDLADQLLTFRPNSYMYYKLGRFNVKTSQPQSMNPNQLLIAREDFWGAGGYDEDFCGHRGHDDHMLHHLLKLRRIKQIDLSRYQLASYSTWDIENDESDEPSIPDASVPSSVFDRSPAHNWTVLDLKLRELEKKSLNQFQADNFKRLRFKWHRVL